MRNDVIQMLRAGRSKGRRRSCPIAGAALAPVVRLDAHRRASHQETPAERLQRFDKMLNTISHHLLMAARLIAENDRTTNEVRHD